MMTARDIYDRLPSTEDLSRRVGLASRYEVEESVYSGLGLFALGMLVGAGLALLFAPKAGQELREDLSGRVNDIRDRMSNAAQDSV